MVDDGSERVQLTDARLLAGLRQGERDAFESLFARHWRTVHGILFRLVGSREEAEDLAQEVFMKLYCNPPELLDQPTIAPWLYRVATNLGYNALRKGGREYQRQQRVQQLAEADEAAGMHAVDPEHASIVGEERMTVRRALSKLSEREQACLVLRHSGLSYAEVAAALNLQVGSVGTILARAEDHFRKVYEGLQEVPHGMRDGR
jgi:RNA polymerase sigma-70 factor, ECF subfamily